MFALLITVILGFGFAYFATQNVDGVTVRVGQTLFEQIPLYAVILGSFFLGMLLAWVAHFFDWIIGKLVTVITTVRKANKVEVDQKTLTSLQQRIKELEIENNNHKERDKEAVEEVRQSSKGLLERFRYRLSF